MVSILVFTLLLFTIKAVRGGEHSFSFRTGVEEDQIVYSKVVVPRHSQRVYVKISADGPLPDGMEPKILLRYNGLPTLENYDASYKLPDSQDAFELIDNQPSEATLFFAFWGGAMPNSHRHFAGKARFVTLSMNALVFACETEVLGGDDCSEKLVDVSPSLDGTDIKIAIETGKAKKTGFMILPDGLDKVIINATLTNSGLQNLCTSWRLTKQNKYHNVQGNTVDRVAILYRCFMNQPDEDRESGRVSHIYDLADVCSSNGRGRLPIDRSAIIINRPYGGTWRISVEIVGVEDDRKPRTPPGFIYDSVQEISVVSRYYSCPSGFSGMGEYVLTQQFRKQGSKYIPVGEHTQQDCQIPVTPLRSFRSSSRRAGLQLRSTDTTMSRMWQEETGTPSPEPQEQVETVLLKQRQREAGGASASAIFSGSLEHLQLASLMGGLVQIEMRVRPIEERPWLTSKNVAAEGLNGTYFEALRTQEQIYEELRMLNADQIKRRLQDNHFLVSVRVGAPSSDATVPISSGAARRARGGGTIFDTLDSFSGDALVLSTRDASVRYLEEASVTGQEVWEGSGEATGKTTSALPYILYMKKPKNPTKGQSERLDNKDMGMDAWGDVVLDNRRGFQYVWTLDKPTINELTATSLHSLDSLYLRVSKVNPPIKFSISSSEFENFVVSIGINVLHCHAGSCVHGKCVLKEDSDVQHSSCECQYPFGGERCDKLSVELPWYIVQVVLLVGSNAAAVPGIIISVHEKRFMLAMCILLAAFSSVLYHLCDMGAVCIAGLSYSAFQAFDVLFCLTTVGTVCLHHSPLGTEAIAALTILLIAASVPGVVHDATHPITVISSLIVSFSLLLCTWLNYAARLAVRTRRIIRQKLMVGTRFKSGNIDASNRMRADVEIELGPTLETLSSSVSTLTEEEEEVGLISGRERAATTPAGSRLPDDTQRQEDLEENEAQIALRALFGENKSLTARLRFLSGELRHSLLGVAISLLGLTAFLLQSRQNYSITHSIWHVCVMLSTYFFVSGSRAATRNIRAVVHHLQICARTGGV